MAIKYKQQWEVPSSSDPSKTYTVSLTREGEYQCSCPQWKFRRQQCKHIQDVMDGVYDEQGSTPEKYSLANVREVTVEPDGMVLIPLIPLGDVHFTATVAYDLLKLGFHFKEAPINKYGFKRKSDVEGFIKAQGRKIYGPYGPDGSTHGYEIVKADRVATPAAAVKKNRGGLIMPRDKSLML